jgi:hypothetical protein
MSIRQRIVSYDRMGAAFKPALIQPGQTEGFESLAGPAGTGVEAAPVAAVPRATDVSEISSGLQALERAARNPDVLTATEHGTASLLQTFFAKHATQVQPAAAGGLEAKFDPHDVAGWIGSFFTWWKGIKPHPWQKGEAAPTKVDNKLRIAVFGDWGTGLYGAPVCARSIAADKEKFQIVLHLGDTYYSGDDDEIKQRLLEVWPQVPGALKRTLNGNHEMYTGGHAYFDVALNTFKQPASYFAFQNDKWILACLDTAYADHDLYGEQVDWLNQLVTNGAGRRLILFSHHQPFSLLDAQGPKLIGKLSVLLEQKKIYAWYWGHEHHCVLYDPHPAWGLIGRCIGHGGYPYFREADFGDAPAGPTFVRVDTKNLIPGAYVLDGQNPYVDGHEKEYGPHGYVVLEFDGPRLNENIMDAAGTVLQSMELAAGA